jgi:hypothetical protein
MRGTIVKIQNSTSASLLTVFLFVFVSSIIIYYDKTDVFGLFSGFFGLSFPLIRKFILKNIFHDYQAVNNSRVSDFLIVLFIFIGAVEAGSIVFGFFSSIVFAINNPEIAMKNSQGGVITVPYAEYFLIYLAIYQTLCVSVISYVFALYERKYSYLILISGILSGFFICILIDKLLIFNSGGIVAVNSDGQANDLMSSIVSDPSNLIIFGNIMRFCFFSGMFFIFGRLTVRLKRKLNK